MTILIEARNIGNALRVSGQSLYWPEADVAKLLGVNERVLQQYECGIAVMCTEQLQQLFTMGLIMMLSRQLRGEFCNDMLPSINNNRKTKSDRISIISE